MAKHIVWIGLSIAVLIFLMVYPFLPGRFDAAAVPLSLATQIFGITGTLLLPIGVLWVVYEIRKARGKAHTARRRVFALLTALGLLPVGLLSSIASFAIGGILLGVILLICFAYLLARLLGRVRAQKQAEPAGFDAMSLALFIPAVLLVVQLLLAAPLASASRTRAIANSGEMLGNIEAYRAMNGNYPSSLAAVWKDYSPGVAGIAQYHYAAVGEGFNLFFEQPLFILDNFGAREFVVYNPLGEHRMISHDSWILLLSPTRLQISQGWFEVNELPQANWRYFWFD